jgi:hypothetical protein
MNEQWDIVNVVSPVEDLTERQRNPRRHARGPSAFSAAVLAIGFALTLPATVVVPLTDSTSDVISVVHRTPKPQPNRESSSLKEEEPSSADFARARSGESLARAFDSYFRPPSDSESEIEPDESCFF